MKAKAEFTVKVRIAWGGGKVNGTKHIHNYYYCITFCSIIIFRLKTGDRGQQIVKYRHGVESGYME